MKTGLPYADDWEQEAPHLAALPKEDSPEVPDGYFASFPDRLMARIKAMEEGMAQGSGEPIPVGEATRAPRRGSRLPFWAIAATVTVLVAATVIFVVRRGGKDSLGEDATALEVQLASLDEATILAGIDYGQISAEEVYAMLGTEGQSNLDLETEIDANAAVDYLNEEDLDAVDLEALDLDEIDLNDFQL